jgi:hypothetical protein
MDPCPRRADAGHAVDAPVRLLKTFTESGTVLNGVGVAGLPGYGRKRQLAA